MESFKLHHKIMAFALVAVFMTIPLEQINEYTYTTGIKNIHVHYSGCFGFLQETHFNFNCNY